MARRKLTDVVRRLHTLAAPEAAAGLTDGQLLERYVVHRDEAAFELLLWRHAGLVLSVCRRVLRQEQDVEDAFQATFLAFVRKAHSIVRAGAVAAWLYKVAYRVALEARTKSDKRARQETAGGECLAVEEPADPVWRELRPILDEEVSRLPERLQRPLVLCYLEGKTNEEAARQLGCPPGTVYSRLARGRELLRARLLRRGLTLSAAALTAALGAHAAAAAPPAHLISAALGAALWFAGHRAAVGVSARVIALAEGVLRAMFLTKIKMAALVLLLVGVLAAGGVLTRQALEAAPQPEVQKERLPAQPAVLRKIEDKPATVHVVKPHPGGLDRTAVLHARVRPYEQQQVVPLVSGTIKDVLVDIGDRVKKGQTLIVVDAPLLAKEREQVAWAFKMAQGEEEAAKARVVTAEAEVLAAKALLKVRISESAVASTARTRWQGEVNRLQREVQRGVVDPQVLQESQNQLKVADAKVQAAEAVVAAARADIDIKEGKLSQVKAAWKTAHAAAESARAVMDKARIQESFTQLKAAFDGVVTRRAIDPGNVVQPGDSRLPQPLLTVQRTDLLRAVIEVPEHDVPLTLLGISAELDINALPGARFPGKVARTAYALDDKNNTMRVEIDVPNRTGLLRPGMFGNVTLHLRKGATDAVTLPEACLVKQGDRRAVYVVRDGKAHRTPVRVGQAQGDKVEVLAGVKTDDMVVANPQGLRGDTVPVEVKKAP